ncbi:hypothetical protein FGIG_09173, partial [Fasciola gigantica]
SSEFQIVPQISSELAGKIHRGYVPVPLLSPFYASYVLPYTKPVLLSTSDSQRSESNFLSGEAEEMSLTGGEFASDNLLVDPIAGDHAAAALLCEKLHYRLRRNRSAFGPTKAQSSSCPSSPSSVLSGCLDELEHLASKGLRRSSNAGQDGILRQINHLLNSKPVADSGADCDDDSDQWNTFFTGDLYDKTERRSNMPKRRRVSRKKVQKQQRLPPFLKATVQFSTANPTSSFEHSRWLSGLDPFLIRLAARTTNPLFQGHGLLCQIRHGHFSTTPHSDWPVLLWSPPKPWDCEPDCPNPLFFSVWSPLLPQEHLVNHVNLSANSMSNAARICELNAIYANDSSRANILSRWTGGSGTDNVVLFHSDINLSQSSPSLPRALPHTFQPALPGRGSTFCFNPWLTDEWAVAGNHTTSSGDRIAFIQLYLTDSSNPVWSGHVALDDPGENASGMNRACCEATGLVDALDVVQDDLTNVFGPNARIHPRFSVFTDGLRFAPFDHFLRIGFGSHPSQLCLTTSQRMILIDTRQRSVAQSLFRFRTGDPALDSLFHITDRFTCAAPRFLEDVYVVAGTAYNMLVLDKRMPIRPVLHWAHSLFGEPTYLDWTLPMGPLREKYDLPQVLVTTCAQNPSGIACFGLNLTSPSGPQLIGPECGGASLSKVFTDTHNELPTQLMTNKALTQRLHSTYCGLVTNVLSTPENGRDYLGSVVLTGAGDLFMHSWYFTSSDESADRESQSQRCETWLSVLRCHLSAEVHAHEPVHNSEENAFEVDLTEIERLESPDPVPVESDPNCHYWTFSHLPPTVDFSDKSEIVQTSRQLICDLRAYWDQRQSDQSSLVEKSTAVSSCLRKARTEEEQLRRGELDSCTEAAKSRVRRLQHILNRLTGDDPVADYGDDEEQFADLDLNY